MNCGCCDLIESRQRGQIVGCICIHIPNCNTIWKAGIADQCIVVANVLKLAEQRPFRRIQIESDQVVQLWRNCYQKLLRSDKFPS